jgi:hypothetical protein
MSEPPKPARIQPTTASLCLTTPLYLGIPLEDEDKELLSTLIGLNFQIDAHCLSCKRESIFKTRRTYGSGAGSPPPPEDWQFQDRLFRVDVTCQRCDLLYHFEFRINGRKLQKIGQFPSMEDIAGADLNKFRSILDPQDFSELHRAGGLASHGIGIGSFVYLRRIFERLISKARVDASALGETLEGFDGLPMDEKIGALRSVLPPALVKNKSTYSILSVGLHELDEKTCLRYFPVVRAAIVQMLEQHLIEKTRKAAEQALELEIQRISSDLRK